MISLNQPVKAKQGGTFDGTPAPEGDYILRVVEIGPWKMNTKTIQYIIKDDNGRPIKDEKGKNKTEKWENCEIHNANIVLEIVGGEHEGKRVWHNLTTHPNMEFSIPNFLYGVGVEELAASQIQSTCVGKLCYASVIIEEYSKEKQDESTGDIVVETRKSNKVKNFKKMPNQNQANQGNEETAIQGI